MNFAMFNYRRTRLRVGLLMAMALSWILGATPSRAFDYGGPLPIVVLMPLNTETTEPSITSKYAPARFVIRRLGDASEPLTLYLRYSGTATWGRDYEAPGPIVTIEAGVKELEAVVSAVDDDLVEGPETVVVQLGEGPTGSKPNYVIDPTADAVRLLIRDNDEPTTPRPPVLSLETLIDTTSEPHPLALILPGVVKVNRVGFAGDALRVGLQAGGTATPGKDYDIFVRGLDQPLQFGLNGNTWIPIPAGETAVTLQILGRGDDLREGDETITLTLQPSLITTPTGGYTIDPAAATAKLILHDVDLPPQPSINITQPSEGQRFLAGTPIEIEAVAIDPHGYIAHVEFYDGEIKIGESRLEFFVAPEPGTPIHHSFSWTQAAIGRHALSVRTPRADGSLVQSKPVNILVYQILPPAPTIHIDRPAEGERFLLGAPVEIHATAIDPQGYIPHVEFYDGETKIGESRLEFVVAPEPGTPIHHSFSWNQAALGRHQLTVRSARADGSLVQSKPVNILVYQIAEIPVVSIEFIATPEAVRDADYAPGYFRIQRTGLTLEPLGVFLKTGGTATAGIDYESLRPAILIPAGQDSILVKIQAIDDKFPEGPESVSLTLLPPAIPVDDVSSSIRPIYQVNPTKSSAELFIQDNDKLSEIASLELTSPVDGEQFGFGQPITIVAIAIDKLADIRRVEFFDGNRLIGVSLHLTKDAVIPGRPRQHEFVWRDASMGGHEILACALDSEGHTVLSKRVQIGVSELPARVALSVVAKDPVAMESGPADGPDSATFTIRRVSGPRDVDVPVFYSLGGTAVNGVDYERLSGRVLLPKGAESVDVEIVPIPDKAIEGDEGIVFTLEAPACIAIFPPPPQCYLIVDPGQAKAVLHDGQWTGNQPPRIALVKPSSGETFHLRQNIVIQAEASDPDGAVRRVEFYDGRIKIGEVETSAPTRAGQPGQRHVFTFVWKDADAGPHDLRARATDHEGAMGWSEPVSILVRPNTTGPVVTVIAWDAHAVEPQRPGELNTATFQIHRSGSTDRPLGVVFALEGTASEGKDYETVPHFATIPAGRSSVFVTITPVADEERERPESVVLRLQENPLNSTPDPSYTIGQPDSARALIADRGWVLPPGLAHCLQLPDGLAHLCFAGADGARFRIEGSTDLLTWVTLGHATALDGACHFVDDASQDQRAKFYRAVPITEAEDPSVP